MVALTPEEQVRQWFISLLRDTAGVPQHLMMSEASLRLADILVYDRNSSPLMVVECKRPELALSKEVLEQAIRYDSVLGVRCIVVTNGTRTCVALRDSAGQNSFGFVDRLPSYEELLGL